jgi:ubiquinone/menaquinone biosynthesis C-methylase UbiE
MSIHRTASQGYPRVAEAYERSRPGYPDDAIAWLAEAIGLAPGRTIVDLAAGTGKLTSSLAATGARVVAVDPVPEMLVVLRCRVPSAEAREATAETTGLPDDCADAVTVAQAFHWFDGPAALAEIDRILRPGGRLALLWNVRDLTHPTQRAVEKLLAPYRGTNPSHRSERWRRAFEGDAPFTSSRKRSFPNMPMLDAENLRERIESTSFIAALPSTELEQVRASVRDLTATLPDRFPFPYTTEVEIFERR